MSSKPANTESFHLFSRLPGEIRLQIWSLILSTPRTIELNCDIEIHSNTGRGYAKSFTTKTPIPPLLHVNHESRYEALKVYTAHFNTEHSPNYIYVAFDRDIIKLHEEVLAHVLNTELASIRYMSLGVMGYDYLEWVRLGAIGKMRRLVELELVHVHDRFDSDGEDGDVRELATSDRYPFAKNLIRGIEAHFPDWNYPKVCVVSYLTGKRYEL